MLVVAKDENLINETYRGLLRHFEVTDLGRATYFLGLEITQENGFYAICLRAYIEKLIARFGMVDAKPNKSPMDIGYPQKNEDDEPFEDGDKYRSLIGALLYVAVNGRPDVANPVGILGSKVSAPTTADWVAAKRVLRYLKATCKWKLVLGTSEAKCSGLVAYSDADWAGDASTRKSTSGGVFILNGGAINWFSRKQNSVSLSTMEAEYFALSEVCQEVLWIRRLLKDLDEEQEGPTTVYEDNQSCMSFVSSDRPSKRSKHIETRQHFVRNLCDRREVRLEYCPTNSMVADLLTKPLGTVKHQFFSEMLQLKG